MLLEWRVSQLGGAYMLALNESYLEAGQEVNLRQGDELALIPPIREAKPKTLRVTDPNTRVADPHPAFFGRIPIRIQGVLMTQNLKKFTAGKKINFFRS